MKITQVTPQKNNPRRFNVFLDGAFGFGADEDLVINHRLVVGKEIQSEDLEKLLYEAEVGKLMERMYMLFSVRQRSEKEVRDYLKQLSFKRKLQDEAEISQLIVEQLIDRLKRKGMVNDGLFAKSWVDARRRSKKLGPRALKAELIKKGINQEVIDQVLSDENNDEELAKEALEKRLSRWQNLPKLELRKKATDYLLRKGFDYSTIKLVLQKVPH